MARRRYDQLIKSCYWSFFMNLDTRSALETYLFNQQFPMAAIRADPGQSLRTVFAQAAPTGRWSSQNPPRSNISRRAEPEVEISDEVHEQLVEVDYAGFELRAANHAVHMDTERRIRAEEREQVRRAVLGLPGMDRLVVPFEIMPFQEEVLRAAGVTVTRIHDSVDLDFGDLDPATIRALLRHVGLLPASREEGSPE